MYSGFLKFLIRCEFVGDPPPLHTLTHRRIHPDCLGVRVRVRVRVRVHAPPFYVILSDWRKVVVFY